MTWFKVDDSFYDHPKVFDAPDCAVALWVRAGTWSARNLTDGFVPTGMPARLCDDPDTAVRELVRRGLWLRASGGYRFHDWGAYQPTADEVRALRAKRAAAGRLGGKAKAAKPNAGKPLASASDVAKQKATPTRPDPSRPDHKPQTTSSSVADKPRPRHGTRLPDDFTVTAEMVEWARAECPDVDGRRETERFRDYWRAVSGAKGVKTDWLATWRNWMRRAQDNPPRTPGNAVALRNGHTGKPSTTDQRVADALALAAKFEEQS